MIDRFKDFLFKKIFAKEVKKLVNIITQKDSEIENLKERIRFLTTYHN